MLKSLKRKTDASPATGIQPWHPNFRNENKLPDVKVIRTSFFVNAGVAFLLLGSLAFVGYQEYWMSDMRAQIADAEARITRDQPASDAAMASYKQFLAEESKAREVEAFYAGSQSMHALLLQVGAVLPPDIALSAIEVTDASVILRGFVSGLPAKASGVASEFERSLRDNKDLSAKFSPITLTSLGRDSSTGRMSFNLEMKRAQIAPKKGKP